MKTKSAKPNTESDKPHHPCLKGFDTCPTCDTQSESDKSIDEILEKYRHWFTHQFTDPSSGLTLESTKDQLYSLLMDVIVGEDEPVSLEYTRNPRVQQKVSNPTGIARNKLRAEQRQKLNQLFNKEK